MNTARALAIMNARSDAEYDIRQIRVAAGQLPTDSTLTQWTGPHLTIEQGYQCRLAIRAACERHRVSELEVNVALPEMEAA